MNFKYMYMHMKRTSCLAQFVYREHHLHQPMNALILPSLNKAIIIISNHLSLLKIDSGLR